MKNPLTRNYRLLSRHILFFAFFLAFFPVSAQKPPVDHSVYDGWKSIGSVVVSDDGKWVSYSISPQEGDNWLYLYSTATGKKDSVARGSRLSFSPEGRYSAFQVVPSFSETREAKKKKMKSDKMPKNSLEIKVLSSGESQKIARVKSFAIPEEKSMWMAYLLEKKEVKKDTAAVADTAKPKPVKKPGKKAPDPEGTEFVITNPLLKRDLHFNDVTEYSVAKGGTTISFLQSVPDTTKKSRITISLFNTRSESVITIFEGNGTAKKLTSDKSGDLVSFIYSADTSKVKVYDLWLSKKGSKAVKIAGTGESGLFPGWSVSENGSLSFSEDGTRLYFGTARKPVKQPEDTLLDDEKYSLDVWSWTDDLLQPMQKKQLDQELKRTYLAMYKTEKGNILQLADTNMPSVSVPGKGSCSQLLGTSEIKYRKSLSWDDTDYKDVYLINAETGDRRLLFENTASEIYLSPSGNYLVLYDFEKKAWLSMPCSGGSPKVVTGGINYPLSDELNDVPAEPRPYSRPYWLDDKRHVLVCDRFDIWSLDLAGNEPPVNITNGYGRRNNLRLRYVRLDNESEFVSSKDLMYLSAFNYSTKESGFFTLRPGKPADPVRLVMDKASYGSLTRAKKADVLLFQKESFSSSPELFLTDMSFREPKKISVVNPQQRNYNWFTAELVEWTSFDNTQLQGILYKPEDFDPAKKYPMIVYFYERSSDGLYSYIPPSPSASRINVAFAASNRYLVFIPDIPYRIGYPGQSCYNAVVSGTYSLLDRFSYIDRTRIGLDGQSWGGYQIAWLVTQTDLFRCAYAGAAVSNMISAYGGIRWETGMSRMFQYEKTQSRIGGTLWEKPMFYIENSPIFYVPKINTPLLLMNNDADGAVPWYQGIEFFTALRRLDKPAWLLTYNDEAHNLVKRPARKDISIRKMQFFDHYLKGVPMPYWMKYGIKQTEKGKISGYDLVPDSITIRNTKTTKPLIYKDVR